MNMIKKLQEKIQNEKETKGRAIVFWYDAQSQVGLGDLQEQLNGVEVRVLNDKNFFQLKIEMEIHYPNQSFLIYSNRSRPDDKENMLLDILLYSAEFKADETAILSETLNVSDQVLRPMMEQYPLFFRSIERKRRLGRILPKQADRDQLELSMMAVLVKVTVPDISVITRQLLLHGVYKKDNELIRQLQRNFSSERSVEIIARHFGVSIEQTEEPMVELSNILIYQHFKRNATFIVNEWESQWASSSPNVCALFIEEWLQRNDSEMLEENIKDWERTYQVRQQLLQEDLENYSMIDAVPAVDALIIENCIDEMNHKTIDGNARLSLIKRRLQMHWGSKGRIKDLYETLYKAIQIETLKPSINRLYQEDDFYESYTNDVFKIDQTYRHFIYYYSTLESKDMLEEIANQLTNWYENEFLRRISEETNFRLEEGYVSKLMPQKAFFNKIIHPILDKEQTRVFVIISDALRYEAAHELHKQLLEHENGTSTLEAMAGSYPTYTQLGMASLLPHKNLTVDDKKVVYADGLSTMGMDNRRKVLQSIEPQSEALKLKKFLDMKVSEIDQLLKGKRLVYLYHDHIDALGDSAKSERETYGAVHQAIQDLKFSVDRLSRLQAKRIFITADHGFLFQFKQIEEYGKIQAVEGNLVDGNRRFAMGHNLSIPEGALMLNGQQSLLKDVEVVLAKGINRFKTGGGLQFIHGGALPQEAVVPLIDYRRIENVQSVDIAVAMIHKVITNYQVPISFYQEQTLSDEFISRKVRMAFYQGDERISNEVELVFNLKGENKERNQMVDFSLVEKHYRIGETCTLRVENVTKSGIETYLEEEFTLRLYEALY